jgi:hypothetical protein
MSARYLKSFNQSGAQAPIFGGLKMDDDLKNILAKVEYHLGKAADLLHDTGHIDSQALDDASTAVEVAMSKIKQVEE